MQALAELGEPKHDLIATLIREMVKGLMTTINEHRQKEGNLRLKDLLEQRVSTARTTSTNSAGRISVTSQYVLSTY